MDNQNQSAYILNLSNEILEDIELQRLGSEQLLLKCSRLARLSGSEEIRLWIKHEMEGYNATGALSLMYMTKTGRWTDFSEKKGLFSPLAQIEAAIKEQEARLSGFNIGNIDANASLGVIRELQSIQIKLGSALSKKYGIRSRIVGLLHTFVTSVYYEHKFAEVASTVFEKYKGEVDRLIADKAGEVLLKFPAVVARLNDDDGESISQALTTCRRIIESFADTVYPPSLHKIERDGATINLDASKHKNRLNEFIRAETTSENRRDRLRKNLNALYDRVCAGVHSDVTRDEALSLFLNVYLFLGEVLTLSPKDGAIRQISAQEQ